MPDSYGRHPQAQYDADAGEPAMRGEDADGCQLSLTCRERQEALSHAWRR